MHHAIWRKSDASPKKLIHWMPKSLPSEAKPKERSE